MPNISRFIAHASIVEAGLAINLSNSATYALRSEVTLPAPTVYGHTRARVAESIRNAFDAGAQAFDVARQNLHRISPTAAVVVNGATELVAKLKASVPAQNAQASVMGVGASVVGAVQGLGALGQAGLYEALPQPLKGLAHPQVADALSQYTGGASRSVTDTVRELGDTHAMVSHGLHTLVTDPLGVAQRAWQTYDANVLSNPLATPQDWYRGFKTATDVGLALGFARVPVLSAGRVASGPMGRIIDLGPGEYSVVREGSAVWPRASSANSGLPGQVQAAPQAAQLPVGQLWPVHATPAQYIRQAPGTPAIPSSSSGSLFPEVLPLLPRHIEQWGAPSAVVAAHSDGVYAHSPIPLDMPQLNFKVTEVTARQARPATLKQDADFSPLPKDLLGSMSADAAEQAVNLKPLTLTRDAQTGQAKIVGDQFSVHVDPQGRARLTVASLADKSNIDGMSWNLLSEQIVETLNRERIPVSEIEIVKHGDAQRLVVTLGSGQRVPRFRVEWADGAGETKAYEFDRPLKPNELVLGERGHYLVFNEKDGLKTANGVYYTLHLSTRNGKQTISNRNQFGLDEIEVFRTDHSNPSELGRLIFDRGVLTFSRIYGENIEISVSRGPLSHPQSALGGTYSLRDGFFPNRSRELEAGTATVDALLHSEGTLVPGRQGVQVDRGLNDDELFQIALDLNNGNKPVEVHHVWADGNDYLMSGNFDFAPIVPGWDLFKRIHSMGHVHPDGVLRASDVHGDTDLVRKLYLHTLQSFPNERLLERTRVVAKPDGTVRSQSYGPTRDTHGEVTQLKAQDLGLLNMDGLTVQMRRKQNGVTVMRIDLPQSWADPRTTTDAMGNVNAQELAVARGELIRAALLEEAKKRGLGVVTFEVSLKGLDSAMAHQIIGGIQGNRLVQSMVEAQYEFGSGEYLTNDKNFVWHEDLNDLTRAVSNREVWLGKK